MSRLLWGLLLMVACVASVTADAQRSRVRVALVVGNGGYGAGFGALANPVRDAKLVSEALRAADFQVEMVIDADQRTLKQAISQFGRRLDAAGEEATGLFYYAGHGVQSRGENYLIPVGATMTSEADLELDAVNAEAVLRQMQEARVATSIMILDACRNMPLTRSFRDGARGLARMDAPNGSYVAYSTAPGQTAADGSGANSPFATAFVREIGQANLPIDTVFTNVRRSVSQMTQGAQTPWSSSSLLDTFVFKTGAAPYVSVAAATPAAVATAPPSDATSLIRECDRLAGPPADRYLSQGISGVEIDEILPMLAIPACEAAQRAAPDDVRMRFNVGRAYSKNGSYDRAFQAYQQAADKGDIGAMSNLGFLYQNGRGVTQNYALARQWYEQAAGKDNANAMTNLGVLYEKGLGVTRNYVAARHWYEKAAVQGNTVAINNLGILYLHASGVTQDYAVARRLFEQAVAKGYAQAMYSLGSMYDHGEGVVRDYAVAKRWYEQAAVKGVTDAMLSLGLLYEKGQGVVEDPLAAREWYQRAVAAGDKRGSEYIERIPKGY